MFLVFPSEALNHELLLMLCERKPDATSYKEHFCGLCVLGYIRRCSTNCPNIYTKIVNQIVK